MIGYAYIEDLFKSVLAKSKAIGGRFHICPRYGVEVNSDQLEEVIKESFRPDAGVKYPLVLMMPPRSTGDFTDANSWEEYRIVLFFLTTTYVTSLNQVKTPNRATGTSQHTVPQDWHDMKRCAINFIRILDRVQREALLHVSTFRLTGPNTKVIDPVSFVGADQISGVRLDFHCSLFTGCEIEDYDESQIESITVPVGDGHPEHKL
jgi:hypothetical protein